MKLLVLAMQYSRITNRMILNRLWGIFDKVIASRKREGRKFRVRDKPSYSNKDVSIVVPTIDTPDTLTKSIRLWRLNNPREIIIVTTHEYLELVTELVYSSLGTPAKRLETTQKILDYLDEENIRVFAIPRAGKRNQLAFGIRKAQSRMIALTDDDTLWPSTLLKHLLAPFEDSKIGGTGGLQSAYIPLERQDPRILTAWEAAAVYAMDKRNCSQAADYALDGGCLTLAGRTALYRAEILQDEAFLASFTNDLWLGKYPLDSGDDTFITRWLYAGDWEIGIQTSQGAEIQAGVAASSKFVKQLIRWERNTIRSFLRGVTIPNVWRYV